MSLGQTWSVNISISSGSWDELRHAVKFLADAFAKAKMYQDRPLGFGGGGLGGVPTSVVCEYFCPVEAKVAQFRKEADELEATLKGADAERERAR